MMNTIEDLWGASGKEKNFVDEKEAETQGGVDRCYSADGTKKIAYAKIFKGYDLGVYDYLSDEIETVERVVKNKFLYFNAVTDKPVKVGNFIIIGEEPFLDEEAAWAPPMASMDIHTISPRAELFVAKLVDRLVLRNLKKYRV